MNDTEYLYDDAYARTSVINSYVEYDDYFEDNSWLEEFDVEVKELLKDY